MSDEGFAALAANTSRLGRGLPQDNRLRTLLRTELAGKALHQKHTRRETQ